jgi:hypothetical protein
MQMFSFKSSFKADVLAFFWVGNCFGYFIKNFGEFSPNHLVALATDKHSSLLIRKMFLKH